MNEEIQENDTPTNEEEVVEPESTDVPEADITDKDHPTEDKELLSALAQKDHFREKAERAEKERKALEVKLNQATKAQGTAPLDVSDYIDISTSLDGLDPREKAYLAEQHKLTGRPLKEIRESEDFTFWDSAYRAKQEKEAALKPNSAQSEEDAPRSLAERLRNATVAEREEILREQGLYKEFRPRADRVKIGNTRQG